MGRRILLGLWLTVSWVVGSVAGVGAAAFRTQSGREVVTAAGLSVANDALNGTLTVAHVGGSLLDGLRAQDLELHDSVGTVVASVDEVGVSYRVRDLFLGRIVLGTVQLVRPHVMVEQLASGEPINLERILPHGEGRGARSLLAFADVRIEDGEVIVRTPASAADSDKGMVQPGPRGPLLVRRIEGVQARLPYVRLVAPDPALPIRVNVGSLAARVSEPALRLEDAEGIVEYWGDSLTVDLGRIDLPETRSTLTGTISWPAGPLEFDLRGDASRASTDALRGLVDQLPPGLRGRGRFEARTESDDVLAFRVEGLDASDAVGGSLNGVIGMVLGPGDHWRFRQTALEFHDFDVDHLRGFVDTLPLAGRLTGRARLDGPSDTLSLEFVGTFADAAVERDSLTQLDGSGTVAVGDGDFVFRQFSIRHADVSLETVANLAPAITVKGRLRGAGTLDGSWRDATFDGALALVDSTTAASTVHGRIRLDSRGEMVGVWADVALDSLRPLSFAASYPSIDWTSAWGGRFRIQGYLDSAAVDLEAEGPAGWVSASGLVSMRDAYTAVRDLRVDVSELNLVQLDSTWPVTALTGRAALGARTDSTGAWHVTGDAHVERSPVAGVDLDSADVRGSLNDAGVAVDTAMVWGYRWSARAKGRFVRGAATDDTLAFELTSDSLGVFEPVLARVFGSVARVSDSAATPGGRVRVNGRVTGTPDAYQLLAAGEVWDVERGDVYVSHAGGTATWISATRMFRVDADVDSASNGSIGVGGVELHLRGRPDSVHWGGRSRFGAYSAWLGGGTWTSTPAGWSARVDSLGLLLSTGPWFLDSGAVVARDDSGVVLRHVVATRVRGAGRVTLDGRVPRRGEAAFDGSIDGLPIQDALALVGEEDVEASGELSGTVQLGGSARNPVIDVALSVRDGAYEDFQAPYTEGKLTYRDRRMSGQLQLFRRGEQILSVNLGLPMDLALVGAPRRRLSGPITVDAVADGVDLSLLEATAPQVRNIAGTLNAHMGVRGTWEQPELTGQVSVREGAVTIPALGVRQEHLNGTFSLAGDTIRVDSLSMRSGNGVAQVTGTVRLEELSRPLLDLHLRSRDFQALEIRDYLSLTATADLDLRGSLAHPVLTGRATATRGVLYFADLLTKQVVNLEDTLFSEFVDTALVRRQRLGAEFQSRFLDSLRIDSLRVDLGSDFWLRSSEANVQLSGAVHVNKVGGAYALNGTLQAPRGTYRLQLGLGTNREFRVTRGQVRYLGTPDLNADLDIDAEHLVRTLRGEDVTITVHIGGSLYDPRLRLSSDVRPPISESEIISYLMFGAPSFQAGTASGELGNRILAQQVFGTLSSQFEYALISDLGVPLDYLQIQPTTSTGGLSALEIAAGKQFQVLGTTAFLSASPRICSSQTGATPFEVGASLEFRLSRYWYLGASMDPRRSCEILTSAVTANYQFGLDLYWEKRY